jgi:hypothetical protein
MNSKEVNMVVMIVLTVFVLLIIQKHLKVNNRVLDFLFVCSIVIIGRKYLKIAILLTFILFLIKTNTVKINEGFQNEIEELDKDLDELVNDDTDDDQEDEPINENENENENDTENEKVVQSSNKKTIKDNEDMKEVSEYNTDCMDRCKKNKMTEKECNQICKMICPNPIKYERNLIELAKFKRIMRELNSEK